MDETTSDGHHGGDAGEAGDAEDAEGTRTDHPTADPAADPTDLAGTPRPAPSSAGSPLPSATPAPEPGPDVTAELPVLAEDAPPAPATVERAAPVARPAPGPRHAAPANEPTRHPRRWFLAGAGAAVVAAAGGTGVALLRKEPEPEPTPPPSALLAAIAAERALLADLDATTGGAPEVRRLLAQVRADHAAHLQALARVAATFDRPATSSSPTATPGVPRSLSRLRTAEARAARTAAGHAAALDGQAATLLASIAACEAAHAELLR